MKRAPAIDVVVHPSVEPVNFDAWAEAYVRALLAATQPSLAEAA